VLAASRTDPRAPRSGVAEGRRRRPGSVPAADRIARPEEIAARAGPDRPGVPLAERATAAGRRLRAAFPGTGRLGRTAPGVDRNRDRSETAPRLRACDGRADLPLSRPGGGVSRGRSGHLRTAGAAG